MTTPPNHNTADQSGANERAKFEAWFEADSMPSESNWFCRDDDGDYYLAATSHAWNAWQARAALASNQPAPQEPVAWIWKYANGEEEVVFIDASKRTWDYENEDVPSKITPLYATPQPFPAPAVQSGDPDLGEMTPPELLAHRLISAWCDAHGKQISWAKAIEITAIVTKMPDAERDRLLAFGSEAIAQTAPAVAGEAIPEGYALVPIEPNDAQQAVGAAAVRIDTTVLNKMFTANRVYRDMVACCTIPRS